MNLRLLLPGLRTHIQQPLRLLMILFGIALGAALCTFIVLINSATLTSLEHSINDLAGETDLTITALGGESFNENTFEEVLKMDGVLNAVPLIQNKAFISLQDGRQLAMTLLGVDLLNDSSVRAKDRDQEKLVPDPLTFMASPDSVALTQTFAKKYGLHLQDKIRMVTSLGVKEYRVRALIAESGPAKAFGGTVAVMDIEASRLAFGKSGKMDQINIRVTDRSQLSIILSGIQSKLGDSFSVEPPSTQLQSLRDIVAPFQKILFFLGCLAFLMAFFLIYNSASMSLAVRRHQIGIMRALGLERSRVIIITVLEYGLIGLLGSAIGSMTAWAVTVLFTDVIQRGFSSQSQAVIPMTSAMMNLSTPFIVTALGAITTIVAVLVPVWKISSASPAEAMVAQKAFVAGEITLSNAGKRLRGVLMITAVLCLVPLVPPVFEMARVLHLLPLVGVILLAPILATTLLGVSFRHLPKSAPSLLRLAWGYAVEKPKRVESTIRGITVGMLLIFVIASLQDGFMGALSSMFINTSRPDFYVSSNGDFISPATLQPIDDRLQQELQTVEGVAGVYGQRIATVQYGKHKIKMNAFDEVPPSTLANPYSYFEVVDRPVAEAGFDLYHGPRNAVMVSESFQSLYGKKTGDEIELKVLDHTVKFQIVGVTRDFTAGGGRLYISRGRYKELWHDPLVTGIAIVLAHGADLPIVKEDIERRFGESHGLIVTIDRSMKKDVEGILKQSFLTFYFIEVVCVLVALLGFISAFLIEIQSRVSEIATLRALGLTRLGLAAFLTLEAFLMGVGASLATLLLAIPVSWGLIQHTLPTVLGWVIGFHFSGMIFGATFLLGIAISTFSALFAVRWAVAVEISEASQSD